MPDKMQAPNTGHLAALGSFRSWCKLLWNSNGIDKIYRRRALSVCLSTFLTSPLRLYEHLRYDSLVANTIIHPSPVFILGHWRTGTTHLHNLLCLDKQFAYVTTFQTIAPGFCLVGANTIKPFLDKRAREASPTRLIDNIPLSFDAPQEEEFAIANMSPYSLIHQYSLPRQAADFFEKYTLFDNLPASELAEWTEIYLTILRKATLSMGEKRLVLKSPNHTARIRTLLRLFPDAKFIHICRDPYNVFRSSLFVYRTVLSSAQLQEVSEEQIKEYILRFYSQLMQRYLAEKSLIPSENLVEVKFENLEEEPLDHLRMIYEHLNLPGFAEAEAVFRPYVSSIAGYKKNEYEIDDDVVARVNQHWQFAFDEWGYGRREVGNGGGAGDRGNRGAT